MAEGAGSKLVTRLAVLAVAVASPLAAAVQWRSVIAEHPVLAAAAAVAYELAMLVLAFAAKVFGDLQGRWVTGVSGAVDRALRGHFSRFERRYLQYLEQIHRFTDLKGLATRGDQTPRLEEVFVDVSLVPRPLHEVGRGAWVGADQPVVDRTSLSRLLESTEPAVLALIGAPGSGKTTLLEHTTVQLALGRHRRRHRRALPVLLFLRDHAKTIVEKPDTSLADRVRSTLADLHATEPPSWLEEQLLKGRCVVMLDGLDEVAHAKDRRLLVEWVDRQIARYPANDWVLTSRPHGYRSAPLNRAQVLQVRRFTGEQIARFLHRWYLAVEQISTGSTDEAVRRKAREAAEDLLDRLRDRPMLYDLAANPLLLTMIANVHRYRGTLPGSRADLYAEICQVLLWRRNEAKRLDVTDNEVTGARKEAVLRELAYLMMGERTRDVSADRTESLLREPLDRIGFGGAAYEFLESVTISGLLVEREMGLYSFAHQTFQEHLAAAHIREQNLLTTLTASVSDPWWRETILLWAARTDPGQVVEACLDDGGVDALSLAFDCMDESATLAPAARERLEDFRRRALLAEPGSEQWRLMTAITLARHLREIVRLSDDALVCALSVTTRIYGLFAAEHPEFGVGPATTDGDDGMMVGIGAVAARAFLQWVNELVGGGTRYQFPSAEQLGDSAFRTVAAYGGHPVWATRGPDEMDALPELWVPEHVPHPWFGTPDRVRERLHEDGERTLREGLALIHARTCALALADALAVARANDSLLDLELEHGSPVEPALVTALDRLTEAGASTSYSSGSSQGRDRGRTLAIQLLAQVADPFPDRLTRARAVPLVSARALAPALTRALAHCPALPVGFDLVDGFRPGEVTNSGLLMLAITSDRVLDAVLEPESVSADDQPALVVAPVWAEASVDLPQNAGPELVAASVVLLALQLVDELADATNWPGTDALRRTLHVCAAHAGEKSAGEIVPVDELAEKVATVAALLRGTRANGRSVGTAVLLADRVVELLPIVLGNGFGAHPAAADALRIGALALAAAGTALEMPELGAACRTVAIGVTVLEDRWLGLIPVNETMFLARA